MGDLAAIKELFLLAGSSPLGFCFDIQGHTPLDLALEAGHVSVLNFLLSEGMKWSKHVVEFNTPAICRMVSMNLEMMPAFLDSRVFTPLPFPGETVPNTTLSTLDFDSMPDKNDSYFDPIGMCGGRPRASRGIVVYRDRSANRAPAEPRKTK